MSGNVHEVDFYTWCRQCKYNARKESDDPCWDCLAQPMNWDSHKPIFWEKGEPAKAAKRPKKSDANGSSQKKA